MPKQRKIVVGMDGSPEARAALEWAGFVAGADDRITVVHAYTTPIMLTPAYLPTMPTVPTQDAHLLAKERLERILGDISDQRVTSWVVQGRPGQAIAAEASDADLVVVGHRGDSQMSMMLGSTANYVLHHASQPVVVVHGAEPTPPRTVVVGIDDHDPSATTSESVRALQWAYRLPHVEEIHVVHAWSLYPYAWELSSALASHAAEFEAAARTAIDRVAEHAGPPPAGVRIRYDVIEGSPAMALLQASKEADLLVVGTRGRGGFRGLLVGSTSTEVAAHSHIPVAVIR